MAWKIYGWAETRKECDVSSDVAIIILHKLASFVYLLNTHRMWR